MTRTTHVAVCSQQWAGEVRVNRERVWHLGFSLSCLGLGPGALSTKPYSSAQIYFDIANAALAPAVSVWPVHSNVISDDLQVQVGRLSWDMVT